MKIKIVAFTAIVLFLIQLHSTNLWAVYQGPSEKIVASLTERPTRSASEDAGDNIYVHFLVRGDGTIAEVIWPEIKIYNADGSTRKINISPASGLEVEVRLFENAIYVLGTVSGIATAQQETIYIYDYEGNLTGALNPGSYTGGFESALSNGEFFTRKRDYYCKYSSNGQLTKTYTSKPLELGVVKEQVISSGKYKTTVSYDDKEYVIIDGISHRSFVRDENQNVYAIGTKNVKKYNQCGKLLSQVDMPSDVVFRETNVTDREPESIEHDRYGEPIVDIHGNVYTSRKTPTKYSILKWTWVDDPNAPTGPDAPTNLAVAASINGLYLTWSASPNDPGCVTGYEIAQATTAGGPYTTLATVNAGVVKYNDGTANAGTTYYYKVRAMAGSDPSPYTAEVSGKR